MTLEEAIEAALTGDSPPLLVTVDTLPPKPIYPASVFTVIFMQEEEDLPGNDNHLLLAHIQIDTYSTRRLESRAIADRLRNLMRGSTVFAARTVGGTNIFETDTRLYRTMREYSVSMTT